MLTKAKHCYASNFDLTKFNTNKDEYDTVIKICGGKPIFISDKPEEEHNEVLYLIPKIWFANPAISIPKNVLANTYENIKYKFYDVDQALAFDITMSKFMDQVAKTIFHNPKSIIDLLDKPTLFIVDCLTGFTVRKGAPAPIDYKYYYLYRIHNFLRDELHNILYDFVIASPYAVYGAPTEFDLARDVCVVTDYLYGHIFLCLETPESACVTDSYRMYRYTFIDIDNCKIEDNDYDLGTCEAKKLNTIEENNLDWNIFNGGNGREDRINTTNFILIMLIVLFIFMCLYRMNKYLCERRSTIVVIPRKSRVW